MIFLKKLDFIGFLGLTSPLDSPYSVDVERKGFKFMFTATAQNNSIALRNYAVIATALIVTCSGLTDIFFNPARSAQQERIDSFSNVISAGLVSQAQTLGR